MTGSETGAGVALIKLYGLKAALGMVGAAALYVVLPPKKPNGHFDEREFVARLAVAGLCSCMFGDWTLQMLVTHAPWLHAEGHAKAVDLLTGAPGWWVTRAVALWFHNRQGKDIGQLATEVKESV